MRLHKAAEIFEFDSPIGEPTVNFTGKKYLIERVEALGKVVWYGIEKNWIKDPNSGTWKEVNMGRVKECPTPIYEKMRMQLEFNLRQN